MADSSDNYVFRTPTNNMAVLYPQLDSSKISTLSQDSGVYAAHPDIVLSKTGKLLAVWRESSDHCNSEGWTRLMLGSSPDSGETWSVRQLAGGSGWNCPRISRISDGRILIVCDKGFGGFNPGDVHGEKISSAFEVLIFESTDDGQTFSDPFPVNIPGFLPDRIQERSDGILMMSTHQPDQTMPGTSPGNAWNLRQDICFSADGGRRWGWNRILARVPGLNLCEGSVAGIDVSSGLTHVCYLRENSFIGLPTYRCVSTDAGVTWSPVQATRMVGHRPTAGQLASGRILVTYRNVQGPESTMAFLSEAEDGRNGRFLLLEPGGGDCGYNGWVQLPDGQIVCVFYSGYDVTRRMTPPDLYKAFVSWGIDPEEAKTYPLTQIKIAKFSENDFFSL